MNRPSAPGHRSAESDGKRPLGKSLRSPGRLRPEWSNVQQKSVVRVTAYVVTFAWSAVIALTGLSTDGVLFKSLNALPLALVILFGIYDRWAWRWPVLVRFAPVPDIGGTWYGHYQAQWIDPDGSRQDSSGRAVLNIKQQLTALSISLLSDESKSSSVLSNVQLEPSGEFLIAYQYDNRPLMQRRSELPSHVGSATLAAATRQPSELNGSYWTDRFSRGEMVFRKVSRRVIRTIDAVEESMRTDLDATRD